MTLFPLTRPRIGLAIRSHGLSAVELRRSWCTGWPRRRISWAAERPLPAGLIKSSSTEPNITDVAKLAEEIRQLLDRNGPVSIALGLPDACARTILFDFETLPAKPAECAALIRWRFQKELNVPAEGTRLAYHIFRTTGASARGPARVLATAVRRSIIEQYEQVCERASLIPVSIGLGSLSLFELCRAAMQKALASRADHASPTELFFGVLGDESFAFIAIRDGMPAFVRMKSRNGNGGASLLLPRVSPAEELMATLQFYDDSTAADRSARDARPLFITGAGAESFQKETIAQAFGVEVSLLTWDSLSIWKGRTDSQPAASALTAAASLLAA